MDILGVEFTEDRIRRYARHIALPEVGGEGQARLLRARVLVVGAGGLGAPLLLYLAAAGVGTLGVADDDVVDLSNLQRQVIHDTASVGRAKADSAAERVAAVNPEVRVERHRLRLDASNAAALVSAYDLVCDGTDNFAARFLLNDACRAAGRTLVSASLFRFDGQLSTFKSHLGAGHPCYRCLVPEPPPADAVPTCAQAGILGSVAGALGTMQATEALKEILGIGESLSGRLVMYDALSARFATVRIPKDPACPTCGGGR